MVMIPLNQSGIVKVKQALYDGLDGQIAFWDFGYKDVERDRNVYCAECGTALEDGLCPNCAAVEGNTRLSDSEKELLTTIEEVRQYINACDSVFLKELTGLSKLQLTSPKVLELVAKKVVYEMATHWCRQEEEIVTSLEILGRRVTRR